MQDLTVTVEIPNWVGCPRCKQHHFVFGNYDGLCDKCCHVLVSEYPNHRSVKFIKASYQRQREQYLCQSSQSTQP